MHFVLVFPLQVLETYKPNLLSRRRRLIEDCVRDLRLNNDHIHIVEQEMRKSIEVRDLTQIVLWETRFSSLINASFFPHQKPALKLFVSYYTGTFHLF